MNIIDRLYTGKINTDVFGLLNIKAVVIYYDYPRCFICEKNDENSFYAFMENEVGDDSIEWCVSPVSLDEINNVNLGLNRVQDLFKDKESYIVKCDSKNSTIKVERIDGFKGKYEIIGNLFMPNFCDMDDDFDYHNLHITSVETKESSVSIVIEGNDEVRTGIIIKVIQYFKDFCKNLKNSIDIDRSRLSLQKGSTVITFKLENENKGNLMEYTDLKDPNDEKIKYLGNVLNASTPEELLDSSNNEKVLKKYLNFMDYFSDQTIQRQKIVISSPTKSNSISINFDKKSSDLKKTIVSEAQKMINDRYIKDEKIINVRGQLTGILTSRANKFSFNDENGNTYEGTVDFEVLGNNSLYIVNGKMYEAKILETVMSLNGIPKKISYKLLNLADLIYEKKDLFN